MSNCNFQEYTPRMTSKWGIQPHYMKVLVRVNGVVDEAPEDWKINPSQLPPLAVVYNNNQLIFTFGSGDCAVTTTANLPSVCEQLNLLAPGELATNDQIVSIDQQGNCKRAPFPTFCEWARRDLTALPSSPDHLPLVINAVTGQCGIGQFPNVCQQLKQFPTTVPQQPQDYLVAIENQGQGSCKLIPVPEQPSLCEQIAALPPAGGANPTDLIPALDGYTQQCKLIPVPSAPTVPTACEQLNNFPVLPFASTDTIVAVDENGQCKRVQLPPGNVNVCEQLTQFPTATVGPNDLIPAIDGYTQQCKLIPAPQPQNILSACEQIAQFLPQSISSQDVLIAHDPVSGICKQGNIQSLACALGQNISVSPGTPALILGLDAQGCIRAYTPTTITITDCNNNPVATFVAIQV